MLWRLLKLDRGWQRIALCTAGPLLAAQYAACGGKPFTSGVVGSATAGTGGSAGDPSTPGDSGSGSEADAGSAGSDEPVSNGGSSSAGSAGGSAVGCGACDVSRGNYCDVNKKCHSCTDFARLEFAKPQPLSTLQRNSERFPRSGYAGSALFYTEEALLGRQLWFASAPTSGIGSATSELGSGPLLAPGYREPNFFFDRADTITGERKLWGAHWDGEALSAVAQLKDEMTDEYSDGSNYSLAVAPSAGHAYWMSTRSGEPQLVWESINETPMKPVSKLGLKIKIGNADCDRLGDDATPWVNLNGTLLLFSAESMLDTCEQSDSNAHDLFAVPLGADGTPSRSAIPLTALNTTGGGSDETDPSLSQDSCSIYFASNSGTSDYTLYRAARN